MASPINQQPHLQHHFNPIPSWPTQPLFVPYTPAQSGAPSYGLAPLRPLSPLRTNLPPITPLKAPVASYIPEFRVESRPDEAKWRLVRDVPAPPPDDQLYTDPKLLEMVRTDLFRRGNKENKGCWQP